MQSAQSGECVLSPVGTKRYEANHRGIVGTMCRREEIERGTHAHRASEPGPVERWWTQDGKLGITIQDPSPESGRRTHLLYFICITFCHVSENLPLHCLMMMIAFITINSGLVPLIEGLCAQIYYFRFEIIGGLHIFCFSFSEQKIRKRKKQLVQDLIPPASIYIHMCSLYTYTNNCMPRFSPSGFFGPSRCLIPTPGLTSEYLICVVYVCTCVYTHIQPHTLPFPLKIEMTQTTPLSFLL